MKAVWTVALVTLLAGCGTMPQMVSGTSSSDSVEANGLFSSFKESNYTQQASIADMRKFADDEASNRAQAGKRFQATGTIGCSIGDMQLVDANDVTVTLSSGAEYAYIHRERFILGSKARAFIANVKGDQPGLSTIYFTVKTGNLNTRIHVDAIKRPDGKIIKL